MLKEQSESYSNSWWIKGLLFFSLLISAIFGLLSALGKQPETLFKPMNFIGILGRILFR
jgi:hypothetical protein